MMTLPVSDGWLAGLRRRQASGATTTPQRSDDNTEARVHKTQGSSQRRPRKCHIFAIDRLILPWNPQPPSGKFRSDT